MIRRFNYTGRKRIPHGNISLRTQAHPVHCLTDVSWDLSDFKFPSDAAIYVEAMAGGTPGSIRIPLGTVGERSLPDETHRRLDDFAGADVFFNFKVIDERSEAGRILGIARNLRPLQPGTDPSSAGKTPLLPVSPCELGDEVWQLDFKNEKPCLLVNKSIDGIMDTARSDPRFFSLVYPAIVRRVLIQILIVNRFNEIGNGDDWQSQWLAWARLHHQDASAPPEAEPDDNPEEFLEWIEQVASGFSKRWTTRARFENSMASGEDG